MNGFVDRGQLIAKMAEAMGAEQAAARVEHSRRAGLAARQSMAAAALDVVCRELGLPTSVDILTAEATP